MWNIELTSGGQNFVIGVRSGVGVSCGLLVLDSPLKVYMLVLEASNILVGERPPSM